MSRLTRRSFLLGMTAAGLSQPLAVGATRWLPTPYTSRGGPFQHGVASGDPLAERVIIWTRVTTADADARVGWEMAGDPDFSSVVGSGVVTTGPVTDYTVKIDVGGLTPGTTYYYRFVFGGSVSVSGRTRTLPVGALDRLRLAVVSCSNYPYGYFNAYRNIAERADLDAVVHLGDYIYEYANGTFGDGLDIGRVPIPDAEIISLADYRMRHAQYKSDPDLQEVHRQHPFITVWDDHETANNAWTGGAQNHDPLAGEGLWALRKRVGVKAYREWMPIRDTGVNLLAPIYRSFRFGDLAQLDMLDTRLIGRDEQPAGPNDLGTIVDPARQLLGPEQEAWFLDRLSQAQADNVLWRLVGQQVMFAPLTLNDGDLRINVDQWDGYEAARGRVLAHLVNQAIDDVVILTGDIHSSWGNDIALDPYDPNDYDPATGEGSLAVEFVTPAVSSAGVNDTQTAAALASVARQTNPHMKYVELNRRGYVLLDVDRDRVQSEWYHLDTVRDPDPTETFVRALRTDRGANRLVEVLDPSDPPARSPVPAL